MPLSAEAQREEKMIAKQAATDEKVRDQRLVRSPLSLFYTIESQTCDQRRRPRGEGRSEPCKGPC
jgi:hypothetical protein